MCADFIMSYGVFSVWQNGSSWC